MKLSADKVRGVFEAAAKFSGDSAVDTCYNYALIKAGKKDGTITTCDGNYGFLAPFLIDENSKEETFLIPINSFMKLLTKLSQNEFVLETEKNKIKVKGKTFKYSLPVIADKDFITLVPEVEQGSVKIKAKDLAASLEKVSFCASRDTSNSVTNSRMQSVYVKIDKETTDIVSTDGTKLALKTLNTKGFINKSDNISDVLMPLVVVQNILPIIKNYEGDIEIKIFTNILQFIFDNGYIVSSRKIDGVYPPYNQIVTLNMNDNEVVVNKKSLLESLKRIVDVAESKIISMVFDNSKLILKGNGADMGEGEETVEISNDKKYAKAIIIIGTMIAEALSQMATDEVVLRLNENPMKAFAMKEYGKDADNNYISAIMPIRQ